MASLKPELDFELFKLILLRESYIKRLQKKLAETKGFVDFSIIGMFDVLRQASIDVVETLRLWERAQVTYPEVKPYLWNGQDYLQKLAQDMDFLDEYPQITTWLGFSVISNPFLIPPEVLLPNFYLAPNSFVVFGRRPDKLLGQQKKVEKKPYIKSPYNTPVFNDPIIFPDQSEEYKLKKKLKVRRQMQKAKEELAKMTHKQFEGDPYESYVSFEVIQKLCLCWKKVTSVVPSIEVEQSFFGLERSDELEEGTGVFENLTELTDTISAVEAPSTLSVDNAVDGSIVFGSSQPPPEMSATIASANDKLENFRSKRGEEDSSLNHLTIESNNKTMRLFESSLQATGSIVKSQVWAPHDIHLQRQVRRRGGELFIVTAAGKKGRLRQPWRRTRFERLETDLEHLKQHSEILKMFIADYESKLVGLLALIAHSHNRESLYNNELRVIRSNLLQVQEQLTEVDRRKGFLQYQYNHFKLISEGSLTAIEKQRRLLKLKEGEALVEDEKLSMSLEDQMAFRIQRKVRQAFGRALRKALIKKRNLAAMKIQVNYRKARVRMIVLNRGKQIALAIMVQRMYRRAKVSELFKSLRREAEERRAVALLQRVYRGYLGRRRLNLKREFIHHIKDAQHLVSVNELTPGHVDELADAIDDYVRSYVVALPLSVLTVIRAALYMFNGDGPEVVVVNNGGFTEKKFIRAYNTSWDGAKLVLRRKSRFIRRLRALITYPSLPNPSRLPLTDDCLLHLDLMLHGLQEVDFDEMTRGKYCVLQLFRLCKHVKRIHELGKIFPEYFDPGQPDWFRKVLKLRTTFDFLDIRRKIESKCMVRLQQHQRSYSNFGKSWRSVAEAVKTNMQTLADVKKERSKAKKRYEAYLRELKVSERKKIVALEGMERARTLARDVAESDLRDYLKMNFIPDEQRLKELQQNVDHKAFSLLQTQADLIVLKESFERNSENRDFESIMKMKHIYEKCSELGGVLGDLLVLANRWKSLLLKIGGEQFLGDLKGKNLAEYHSIQTESLQLMETRRKLNVTIAEGLEEQYLRVQQLAYEAGLVLRSKAWDNPTDVEVEAEEEENRECSRREADFETRQKRQAEFISIPSAPFHPVLLLVDCRIPKSLRALLVENLAGFDFVVCSSSTRDPQLLLTMQELIDAQRNILLFVNRGATEVARRTFISKINCTLAALIPKPRVVAIDATMELRIEDWHSILAPKQEDIVTLSSNSSAFADLLLGRIRKRARLWMALMLGFGLPQPFDASCKVVNLPGEVPFPFKPYEIQEWLHEKFVVDFRSFIHVISFKVPSRKMSFDTLEKSLLADFTLAGTLACILDYWESPVVPWKDKTIIEGAIAFKKMCSGKQLRDLCTWFEFKNGIKADVTKRARIRQAMNLSAAWNYFEGLAFQENPARLLLYNIAKDCEELIESLVEGSGLSDSSFNHCDVSFVHNIRWIEDVRAIQAGVEIIGNLLSECFQDSLIFEEPNCPVKYFFDRGEHDSMEHQSIGTVQMLQHVRVYQRGDETFVSVKINHETETVTLDKWTFFGRMKVKEIITMLQPNNTEIFEGKVKKFDIREGGKDKWYELLSKWACLDNIGEKFCISLIRARYLILSKLGMMNGYLIRQEIFEERFGEIRILLYGVLQRGAINYYVDRERIYELLPDCDVFAEKDKLEGLDTQSIAYIFSNRLQICPSLKWKQFLNEGELLPKSIHKRTIVKLRKKRGPGRLVGSCMLTVSGVKLILTIYEIDSEMNTHELRIVLYDTKHSQTAEYCVSPMERMMLFTETEPLLKQISDRIRYCYCDLKEKKRVLLHLDSEFVPQPVEYLVEGKREYTINIDEEKKQKYIVDVSNTVSYNNSDEKKTNDDETASNNLAEESHSIISSSCDGTPLDNANLAEPGPSITDNSNSLLDRALFNLNKPMWGWALYFDRAPISELKGNLRISATLSTARSEFIFIVHDQKTFRESYRTLSFRHACHVLYDKTLESLEAELANLDESITFDLLDELMSLLVIEKETQYKNFDDDEQPDQQSISNFYNLYVRSEQDNFRKYSLSHLRIISKNAVSMKSHMAKPKDGPKILRIALRLFSATDLKPLDNFPRNPICVVKWNMREIGRTNQQLHTCDPVWQEDVSLYNDNLFEVETAVKRESNLELEMYDTNLAGVPTDFLGGVQFSQKTLLDLLDSGGSQKPFNLEGFKRYTVEKNTNAGGSILVSCTCSEPTIVNRGSVNDELSLAQSLDEKSLVSAASASSDLSEILLGVDAQQPAKHDDHRKVDDWENEKPNNWAMPYSAATVEIITLSILALDRLPSATDLVLIVQFNGWEIERLKFTSSTSNYMEGVSHLNKQRVILVIPQSFSVGCCSLTLKLHKIDDTCLGQLNLNGKELSDFVFNNDKEKGDHASWLELPPPILSDMSKVTGGPSRIELRASSREHVPDRYTLYILSGKGLANMDTFSKSDPFVTVRFNDVIVGKTRHIDDSLEPDWGLDEKFMLEVPAGLNLVDCRLELEMYDYDFMSAADFMGSLIFEGQQLMELFQRIHLENNEIHADNNNQNSIPFTYNSISSITPELIQDHKQSFPLQASNRRTKRENSVVKGELTIFGHAIGSSSIQRQSSESVKNIIKKSNVNLLREKIYSISSDTFRLHVIAAKNLANADTFGKSDPFVVVFFNGRPVGQTKTIDDTLNPVWNESIDIRVPLGHKLHGSCLELEVYDRDNNSIGDFLGYKRFEGETLVKLLDDAMRGASNETLWLALEKHPHLKAKANSIVRGDIQLSFSAVASKDALREGELAMLMGTMLSTEKLGKVSVEIPKVLGLKQVIDASKSLMARVPGLTNDFVINAVLTWNAQEIFEMKGKIVKDTFEWVGSSSRTLFIPIDHEVFDCSLELVFWYGKHLLGGVYQQGEELERFLEVNDKTENMIDTVKKRKSMLYELCKPITVPTSFSGKVDEVIPAGGKVLLTGSIIPYVGTSGLSGLVKKLVYPVISTELPEDQGKWRYHFGKPPADELKPIDGATSSAVQRRQSSLVKVNAVARKTVQKDENSDDDSIDSEDGKSEDKNEETLTISQKMQIEQALATFAVKSHIVADENRVCWRGRVMPKNFHYSGDKVKKAILQARSSRLLRTKSITEMQVLAEVHYLTEYGDEEEVSQELPVNVKEILTTGPGIIQKRYRIELCANNGILLGFVDIENSHRDMKSVLGSSCPIALDKDKNKWNLGNLFSYIVRERMVLDMMQGGKARESKDTRREGIVTQTEGNEFSGSIITLIRDEIPDDAMSSVRSRRSSRRRSRYGRQLSIRSGMTRASSLISEKTTIDDEMKSEVSELEDTPEAIVEDLVEDLIWESVKDLDRFSWIRLHSKTHWVTGKLLKTVIVLQGYNRDFDSNPEEYLKKTRTEDILQDLELLLKCRDIFNRKSYELLLSGSEVLDWTPLGYTIDLSTKFRRDKFGSTLLEYLSMKFLPNGEVELFLINEEKVQHKSMEDLLDDKSVTKANESGIIPEASAGDSSAVSNKNGIIEPSDGEQSMDDANTIEDQMAANNSTNFANHNNSVQSFAPNESKDPTKNGSYDSSAASHENENENSN